LSPITVSFFYKITPTTAGGRTASFEVWPSFTCCILLLKSNHTFFGASLEQSWNSLGVLRVIWELSLELLQIEFFHGEKLTLGGGFLYFFLKLDLICYDLRND